MRIGSADKKLLLERNNSYPEMSVVPSSLNRLRDEKTTDISSRNFQHTKRKMPKM